MHTFKPYEAKFVKIYYYKFVLGTSFVNQILIKYESKAKCESVLDEFKKEFSSDFPEISTSTFGDDSYFGEKT